MSRRDRAVRYLAKDGSIREVHFDATGRDIHVDEPLTAILQAHHPGGFIADIIAPVVPVAKQFDMIGGLRQADFFRQVDDIRAPKTTPKKVSFEVTSDSFFCKNHALRAEIAIEDMVNADEVWNLREQWSLLLKDLLFVNWETRVSTLMHQTVNVATVHDVVSLWSDRDNSNPLDNEIDPAKLQFRAVTGKEPNTAIFGFEAWHHFVRNAKVRAQLFPAPGAANITAGEGAVNELNAANFLNINRVIVAGAQHNTAAEGLGLSLAETWGPHVWLAFIAPRPSRLLPSYMYSFRWTADRISNLQLEDLGFDTDIRAQKMDLGFYTDEKVLDANFASRISSVV